MFSLFLFRPNELRVSSDVICLRDSTGDRRLAPIFPFVVLERVTKPGLAPAESLKRLKKVTFKGACPGFVRAS
ncbi:MAG: hypothetical protein ACK50J_30245 [Planctomyces sp.]